MRGEKEEEGRGEKEEEGRGEKEEEGREEEEEEGRGKRTHLVDGMFLVGIWHYDSVVLSTLLCVRVCGWEGSSFKV